MVSPSVRARSKADSSRHYLEQVAVRVTEVEPATAMAVIDFHVLRRARAAAIGQPLAADAIEDPVELRFADLEGIVMPLEAVPIIEIDGQRVIDPHRGEVGNRAIIFQPKDMGEEAGRLLLVARGHDRVIEDDGHRRLLMLCYREMSATAAIGKHRSRSA